MKGSVTTLFLIFISSTVFGQDITETRNIDTNTAGSSYYQYDIFNFPNVNKIYQYRNDKQLREIQKLDRQKNWEELYPILKDYVANFGIANFFKETYYIWRLAKLTELFGDYEESKLLYKLVLKHHPDEMDIRSIELYYDSLTANDRDYYVPLEYYYELVEYRKEVDTLRPPKSVLLNMGIEINSELADYGPTLGGNDNTMIFTSKRNSHHRGLDPVYDEDLFLTQYQDGYWSQAEELQGINSRYNEGSATISKDGNEIFFARCNSPEGFGDCDLYTATKDDTGKWSSIENLGAGINGVSWDSHPSLSHSEDTLYFASDRIGGFGNTDIYYSIRDGNGGWTKAKNIGPIINTRSSEVSPFYHHVHNVLYFSSDGHGLNFGEFDIYKTYRVLNSWSEPKNIGPLVNGPGSEYYFTIDSKSEKLYYAKSVRENLRNMDLYSFPVPMGAQPLATTQVTGSLINQETGDPMKGIVSIIDLDRGIEVAPKFLRPDGTFEFDLINNSNYLLVIQGDHFFRVEELFYLDGDKNFERKAQSISRKIEFTSINFGNGEASLSTQMYNDLDKLADFMLDNPDLKLNINGHTDSEGREEFNLKLSQERADAIREYLIFFGGVDETRIQAKGYGSSKPVVMENSEDDKRLNRRVEFEIYQEEEIN